MTNRVTTWGVELLDEKDQLLRELNTFTGGNLECNRNRAIWGGGSIQLETAEGWGIDWGKHRFRIVSNINGETTNWGVYLPDVPTTLLNDDRGTEKVTVTLLDKLAIPQAAIPETTVSYPAGSNVVETVVNILQGLGETRVTAVASPLTLPVLKVYPADDKTTWLKIINDLLTIINYRGVYVDREGVYRIEPYTDPAGQQPEQIFQYGPDSIYLPEWDISQDWFNVPNHVRLTTRGESDQPGLVANAYNTDPDSKFSTVARGRTISKPIPDVEAADQTTLDGLAGRALRDATTAVTNMGVTVAPTALWPGTRFDLAGPNSVSRGVLNSWNLSLDYAGLMKLNARVLL